MPSSRRRSLAVKIPLLLLTLLLLALAGMSAASYLELRASLIEIATGRLQRAADYFTLPSTPAETKSV